MNEISFPISDTFSTILTTNHDLELWLSWMDGLSERGFVVIDNFLSESMYRLLRDAFLTNMSEFSKAGIGALELHTVDREIRGDYTWWLDQHRDTQLQPYWDLVEETIHVFNRYCYLSLSGYEFHFAHYPPGGHYDKHVDQFEGRNNRMISMVIYLNEGWQQGDGGELKVFEPDGKTHLIEPIARRCVLFKSAEVPHQVMQAFKSRYSLTGWLLYQPAVLGQFFG